MTPDVFISLPEYTLGQTSQDIEESAKNDQLFSEAEQLIKAGFRTHHLCRADQTAYDLAVELLTKMEPKLEQADMPLASMDTLIYATCLPINANVGSYSRFQETKDIKSLIDYPASHLQARFNMDKAFVVGIDQQACTSMLGAIRLARNFLVAEEELNTVLCLTADRFPAGAKYEQSYNLISDGAAGVVVSRRPMGYKLIAAHQITNGSMAQASDDETVGHYFSYSRRLLQECLEKANLTVTDIDHVIPQNTNKVAWQILSSVMQIPLEKVHMKTIGEAGHCISGDNIINLKAMDDSGEIKSGEKLLMLMAGFGLNWQCLIVEKL